MACAINASSLQACPPSRLRLRCATRCTSTAMATARALTTATTTMTAVSGGLRRCGAGGHVWQRSSGHRWIPQLFCPGDGAEALASRTSCTRTGGRAGEFARGLRQSQGFAQDEAEQRNRATAWSRRPWWRRRRAVEEEEGRGGGAGGRDKCSRLSWTPCKRCFLVVNCINLPFPTTRPGGHGGIKEQSRSRSVGYGISDPYVMKKHESLSPSPIGRIGIAAGDDDCADEHRPRGGNSTRSHGESAWPLPTRC